MGQLEEEEEGEEEEFPFLEPRSSEVTRRFDGKTRFGQQVGHLAGFLAGGRRFERFEYGDNAISEGNVV